VPVIMVTARTTESDTLAGLAEGPDDYVHKPFSPRELTARVSAVLRRSRTPGPETSRVLRCDRVVLDAQRHEVSRDGTPLALTPREFDLLEWFLRHPGRAFTRGELLHGAFGEAFEGTDRTVDAHIKNLRQKIEEDPARPRLIVTVFGVGYRLDGAVE